MGGARRRLPRFHNLDVAGIVYNARLFVSGKLPYVDSAGFRRRGAFLMVAPASPSTGCGRSGRSRCSSGRRPALLLGSVCGSVLRSPTGRARRCCTQRSRCSVRRGHQLRLLDDAALRALGGVRCERASGRRKAFCVALVLRRRALQRSRSRLSPRRACSCCVVRRARLARARQRAALFVLALAGALGA